MNVSRNWLLAFVDAQLSANELRDLITERCAPVDGVEPLRADLAPIVIGRVVSVEKHPDSDHLTVTKVDAGGGTLLDVVCGAPNVAAGKLYPFAPVGTVMPGGLKVERRKIRGAVSQGMLCSARELVLGEDYEGIMELSIDVEPGTPFLSAMPVGDTRIIVDVTPNRPDLLSHLGFAREIAAATGKKMDLPKLPGALTAPLAAPVASAEEGKAGSITVRLEDPEGAPRYMGVTIRGVKVAESPKWLAERIRSIGGRPINNVVDITNYILHELGQPVHAFDAAKLEDSTVIVRRARRGEKVRTLDGTDRFLETSMTVIADGETPQAIAGVMGGERSEVSDGTTDIFLEVACFDARRIRATRRTLNMSTDASYRFERGVDPEVSPVAMDRATRLIIGLAGGTVEGAPVDLRPSAFQPKSVMLRVSRVEKVLGEEIAQPAMRKLLKSVGFAVNASIKREGAKAQELDVVIPSWRPDVTAEIDLIEEIARLHGYERFSDELRPYRLGTVPESPLALASRRVREVLVASGLLETRPLPFVDGRDIDFVRVSNPIAENEAHFRRDLLTTLATRAEYNLAHMQRSVRLFEIGAVMKPGDGRLPVEELRVAALVLGERRPPHFTEPKPPNFDEWDVKGLAERVAQAAFPGAVVALEPATGGALWIVVADEAGRGVVRRVELDAPVWAAPAFGFEISLATLDATPVAPRGESAWANRAPEPVPAASRTIKYRPIPTNPAVEIDLALVVPDAVAARDVEDVMVDAAGPLLERIAIFDEFRGGDVAPGHRSVAWRLTFRHPERTLGAKEIDGRRERLLKTLEGTLGIRQRSN